MTEAERAGGKAGLGILICLLCFSLSNGVDN